MSVPVDKAGRLLELTLKNTFSYFQKITEFGNGLLDIDFGIYRKFLPKFTGTRIQRESRDADADDDIEVGIGVNQCNTNPDNENNTCQPDSDSVSFSLGRSK